MDLHLKSHLEVPMPSILRNHHTCSNEKSRNASAIPPGGIRPTVLPSRGHACAFVQVQLGDLAGRPSRSPTTVTFRADPRYVRRISPPHPAPSAFPAKLVPPLALPWYLQDFQVRSFGGSVQFVMVTSTAASCRLVCFELDDDVHQYIF